MNQFDFAVKMFDQRGAALHPVATVQIIHAVNFFDLRAVDVAADHAVRLVASRHGSQRILVFGHELDGGLGFEFQERSKRPITETHRAPQPIEIQVKVENPVVKMRAELFEQVVEMRQAIRLMSVDNEIFFPIGSRVHDFASNGDIPEFHSHELLDELVVVAGDVDDFGLLPALAK